MDLGTFFFAFGLVFVAELGDKSQLLTLSFASRYPVGSVLGGVAAASMLLHLISAAAGSYLSQFVSPWWIGLVAGLAFIGFGIWTLREGEEEHGESGTSKRGAFITVFVALVISELGDKTMLTSLAIAGSSGRLVAVWLGGGLGMFVADALAIVAGVFLGRALPERALRIGAGVIFIATGLFLLGRLLW